MEQDLLEYNMEEDEQSMSIEWLSIQELIQRYKHLLTKEELKYLTEKYGNRKL